jgi:hypothetical protein
MKPIKLDISEPGHLNLAALMIYGQIQKNLGRPERTRWIKGIDFTIQFQAARMSFAIIKEREIIQIKNGPAPHPEATLRLQRIRFWGNPILPLLRRQIRLRGNLFKLFRFLLFITP